MIYNYVKDYAAINYPQLLAECLAANLPVADVQQVGDGTINVVTSRDLTPAEKATLDGVVAAHDGRPRRARPLAAIYADLLLLSAAQQDAVIADLQLSGAAPTGKWSTIRPPQDGPAAAFYWAVASLGGATAAEKRKAAAWVAGLWCQQNPKYLVNQTFGGTVAAINVAGDQLA